MPFNGSRENRVIGLAALGLLAVAGIRLSLRTLSGGPAPQDAQPRETHPGESSPGELSPTGGAPPNDEDAPSPAPPGKLPYDFFLVALILFIPFYLFGARSKLPLPVNLPLGALATFVPAVAGLIVSYRHRRLAGVKQLLSRAVDYKRIRHKAWYIPILFLAPLIYLLSYLLMRLAGLPLPDPRVSLLLIPPYLLMYLIGDTGEELGFSGYALDPLQKRWGPLAAGLALGVVWAIYHFIPFVQTGNSLRWIAWQSLKTVAMRVILVWIYNRAGKSVLATTLYHVTDNISWSLFPNDGSHYDPLVTGLLTTVVAILLTWRWPLSQRTKEIRS